MSQHDMNIATGSGANVRADLNLALAALVSNNSGATEPATPYAYMWWADTTTGKLKIRNAANNAWIEVGTLASANLGLALLAGSASQVFSVGTATAAAHAMRADQIATKNLVINGGMQVNQAPTAALSGTLQFGSVDMMVGALAGSAASGTLTQATNGTISPATTKCLHLSGISFTSGYVSAGTRIKASRTAELNGKTISVRARVYHDFGVGCPVTFVLNKANSADVFSAVTNISTNGGATVATATATEITGTFTLGATDGNTGLELLVQGSTLLTVASKNFYLAELEMWIGSAPTTFRANSYEQDLLECLPYYFSTFPKGTAPAQNAGGTGIVYRMPVNNVLSGVYLNFPVPMRATPSTMTGYNPSAANANWRNFSINADSAAVAFTTTTARGTFLDNASVAGDLQTHALRCHVTADARLF